MSDDKLPTYVPEIGTITISLLPRDIVIKIEGEVAPVHMIMIRGQLAQKVSQHLAGLAKKLPPTTPPTPAELASVGVRNKPATAVTKETANAKA